MMGTTSEGHPIPKGATELKGYPGSYCDDRILAMGFMDNSWVNNTTGSVTKTIGTKEVEVYCPNSVADEGDGHSSFTYYGLMVDAQWYEDKEWSADEIIDFVTKLEATQVNTQENLHEFFRKKLYDSIQWMEEMGGPDAPMYIALMEQHIADCQVRVQVCKDSNEID